MPTIEVPKFDMPKIEAPKFDMPAMETPKFDMRKIETPKFEVPSSPKFDMPDTGALAGAATKAPMEAAAKAKAAAEAAGAQASAQTRGALGAVESVKSGLQREAMTKARDARKKLYGTAGEKFAEAASKEAEAREAAKAADEGIKKSKKVWGEAKAAAAKADSLWSDVAKKEAKATKDQLKGAEATAVKALQAQEAYAAKTKAGVGQTYGKAEALRARGDAKGAAALYAEAARSTAEFKALPSMETLGAYPSLLATAAAALDAAKIEVLRGDLSAAMSLLAKAEALTTEGGKAASKAIDDAFKAGNAEGGSGVLDPARLSWAAAEAAGMEGSAALAETLKSAAMVDSDQAGAIKSLGRVHLDQAPQFAPVAKEVANIASAQADLKPVPGTAAAAEKVGGALGVFSIFLALQTTRARGCESLWGLFVCAVRLPGRLLARPRRRGLVGSTRSSRTPRRRGSPRRPCGCTATRPSSGRRRPGSLARPSEAKSEARLQGPLGSRLTKRATGKRATSTRTQHRGGSPPKNNCGCQRFLRAGLAFCAVL